MRALPALLFVLALAPRAAAAEDPPAGRSVALIVVGLGGDKEHEALFATTAAAWRDALAAHGFPRDAIRILAGHDAPPAARPDPSEVLKKPLAHGPATRAALETEVARLRDSLRPDDRLWVFFLGHADHDGRRAAFHLPGPDLTAADAGKLFANLPPREQVFWLTFAASGSFVKPLAARDRSVIAATEPDGEIERTEFPLALADALREPLEKLDADRDGRISVLELYRRTALLTEARFAADRRVATEHPLLDDNGDGVGTEAPVLPGDPPRKDAGPDKPKPTADGPRAARTFLPGKASGGRQPPVSSDGPEPTGG